MPKKTAKKRSKKKAKKVRKSKRSTVEKQIDYLKGRVNQNACEVKDVWEGFVPRTNGEIAAIQHKLGALEERHLDLKRHVERIGDSDEDGRARMTAAIKEMAQVVRADQEQTRIELDNALSEKANKIARAVGDREALMRQELGEVFGELFRCDECDKLFREHRPADGSPLRKCRRCRPAPSWFGRIRRWLERRRAR